MKIKIHGAQALKNFTKELLSGFDSAEGVDDSFELFQIHGAPHSLAEDKYLLTVYQATTAPKMILIHRPDEVLLNSDLKIFFEQHPKTRIIFFGDLLLQDPFWLKRKEQIEIIPHFYTSLSLPAKSSRVIVGSFTSWGELRKLEHYESLVKALKALNSTHAIQFLIGGTLNGVPLTQNDLQESDIEIAEAAFVPHFNVQLYHLNGQKRLGESSGSLHAGISIPVIFEANGMERIEGVRVIKISATDDLQQISYAQAAQEIFAMLDSQQLFQLLQHNVKQARLNTSVDFANMVISMVMA